MIVVAGGSATRFGGEKLMADVAGRPLIAHTIEAVSGPADITIVSARIDLIDQIEALGLEIRVIAGGSTRTDSEMAGLAALGREYDLIGIHDGARPLVAPTMVEALYKKAAEVGGAVPALDPGLLLVDRARVKPITDAVSVQTPQIFRGPELLAAYVRAAQTGFEGHDTMDVVGQFGDLQVTALEGDPGNIKVTYQSDLETIRSRLEAPSRSEPR